MPNSTFRIPFAGIPFPYRGSTRLNTTSSFYRHRRRRCRRFRTVAFCRRHKAGHPARSVAVRAQLNPRWINTKLLLPANPNHIISNTIHLLIVNMISASRIIADLTSTRWMNERGDLYRKGVCFLEAALSMKPSLMKMWNEFRCLRWFKGKNISQAARYCQSYREA